jgi:hypothetical protein
LKFGPAEVAVLAKLVVTVVHSLQAVQEETTLLKLLLLFQDVNTLFVQADRGPVKSHTHVAEEWDVVHM